MADPARHALPYWARWAVMLTFGGGTSWMILSAEPGANRADLLLFATGVGCIFSAFLWFFCIAIQRSLVWSLILLVPFLNTLVLPVFVRHYWREGARVPAFLALGGVAGELTGALRLIVGSSAPLV